MGVIKLVENGMDSSAGAPNRLRELRDEKGWSLVALAERSGLSAPYIFKLENGTRRLSDYHARKLARALGIPTADLFSHVDGGLDQHEREIVRGLRELPPSAQNVVSDFIRSIRLNQVGSDPAEETPPGNDP